MLASRIRNHLARAWARCSTEAVVTSTAVVGGGALIAGGVALYSLPAGLIVAGVELAAGAIAYMRPGRAP